MRKIIFFIALFLLIPRTLFAEITIKPTPEMLKKIEKKPCEINVTSPTYLQWCYINEVCPIVWDTSNIKNWNAVFLFVIQIKSAYDEQEGGGYPVPNTGNYQWVVPENVGPLSEPTGTAYQIKVMTPDQKCSGKSAIFGIKKKSLFLETPIPLQKK